MSKDAAIQDDMLTSGVDDRKILTGTTPEELVREIKKARASGLKLATARKPAVEDALMLDLGVSRLVEAEYQRQYPESVFSAILRSFFAGVPAMFLSGLIIGVGVGFAKGSNVGWLVFLGFFLVPLALIIIFLVWEASTRRRDFFQQFTGHVLRFVDAMPQTACATIENITAQGDCHISTYNPAPDVADIPANTFALAVARNHYYIAIVLEDGRLLNGWYKCQKTQSSSPDITKAMGRVRQQFELHDRCIAAKRRLDGITRLAKRKVAIDAAWENVALPVDTKSSLRSLCDMIASDSPAAPAGILLYGPPGTGKTKIAETIAKAGACNFVPLSLPDLKAGSLGQSAGLVRQVWADARAKAPTILFIDECEGLFASRTGSSADALTREIVQAFLAEWNGIASSDASVCVIGATNQREVIDRAILSRFANEIQIGLPDGVARRTILKSVFEEFDCPLPDLPDIESMTSGMSGRDLRNLAKKAFTLSHPRLPAAADVILAAAQKRSQSSDTADCGASWDTLILPDETKANLHTTVEVLRHAETFGKSGISIPRSLLLSGPPGTGKTQIGRTLANESGLSFISVTTADLKAGFIGQSGILVKEVFARARASAPAILFIDEIDLVAPTRGEGDAFTNEIVGELLQQLDGLKASSGHVFVMAATNHAANIDPAIRSRFADTCEIPLPNEIGRIGILNVLLNGKPHDLNDQDIESFARQSENCSGRDLRNLIASAERRAVRRALADNAPDKVRILSSDLTRP